MSGPSYPLPIGTGPEGVLPFSVWTTVISQYANSDILTQLITNMEQYVDQTKNLDAFYQYIWNVDTAEGLGLDIWGRIVAINRTVQIETDEKYLGFKDALPSSVPFGSGTFVPTQGATTNYVLPDAPYRTLILAKALANITDGSIKSINQILINLFPGRGNCYVIEPNAFNNWYGFHGSEVSLPPGDVPPTAGVSPPTMTMTYLFEFPVTLVEKSIIQTSGVLPKPTGVSAYFVYTIPQIQTFSVTVDGTTYSQFSVSLPSGIYEDFSIIAR